MSLRAASLSGPGALAPAGWGGGAARLFSFSPGPLWGAAL